MATTDMFAYQPNKPVPGATTVLWLVILMMLGVCLIVVAVIGTEWSQQNQCTDGGGTVTPSQYGGGWDCAMPTSPPRQP